MTTLLQVGPIRLAVLASDGTTKTKTLILPPPSRDGLELDWEEDSTTVKLVGGGRRTRRIGYLPVLTVRWKAYDDLANPGITIGTANGNRPSLEDLLVILSAATRGLRVSPGASAGGFTVDQVVTKQIGKKGPVYTGVQATFYGRDPLATKTLEVF